MITYFMKEHVIEQNKMSCEKNKPYVAEKQPGVKDEFINNKLQAILEILKLKMTFSISCYFNSREFNFRSDQRTYSAKTKIYVAEKDDFIGYK